MSGAGPPRGLALAGLLAGWGVAFLWALRPIWGIDVFFHVAIGREVLAHGMPATDVFSAATPDAPWTPFQLGYELLVAGLDGLGGLDLLRVVHAALVATALVLLARGYRRLTGSAAATVALMALTLLLFDDRLRLRPHVLNLVLEAAVLLPLAAGRWREAPRRWQWIVLGVAGLWAFFHAAAALWLIAVVGTVLVAGPAPEDRRWAAKSLLFAVLAVLAVPGAAGGIAHVAAIQGEWAEFVPELAPSWSWFEQEGAYAMLMGALPWVGVLAVGLAVAARPEPPRRATVLAAAGLAFGAVWMVRLGYYAPLAVALVAPELRRLAPRLASRRAAAAALAIALALVAVLGAHVLPRWDGVNPWTTTLHPGHFPVAEVRTLKLAGVHGRIFNEAEWGGYLLWALHPPSTVLSDGRVTFDPAVGRLLRADRRPSQRGAVAEAAYRAWGVDLLVRRRGAFAGGPGWVLLLRGPAADVWSREGAATERRRDALGRALKSRYAAD